MNDNHSHTPDTEESQSRKYDLILEEESSNPKVRGAIQEHAGVDRAKAEEWMRNTPSVILKDHPLQDVVELRSLLMRLGASVRIEEVYLGRTETVAMAESEYEVLETTPTVEHQEEVDQSLDKWFPERKNIPTTKVSSGSLYGSRLWTCLVSVVIIAIVLSALVVGMFQCMETEDEELDKAGRDEFSRPGMDYQPVQLPTLAGLSARLNELTYRANAAVENLDGAEASRLLDDHDKLHDLKELSDALDQRRDADSEKETQPRTKTIEQSGEDAPAASEGLSGEAAARVFPATIAALKQLKDRHQLESGLTADWEATGTALSAHTNLPESARVDVEVGVPGQKVIQEQSVVARGIINLPAVEYLPAGTLVIQIQLTPLEDQPKSVQLSFLGSPEFEPEKWGLKVQLTLEEERALSEVPTLEASIVQIAGLMANGGVDADVSMPDINVNTRSPLVIEGESQDPFLFLKSAVQASGSITQTVNDPAPWVLIRVNQVEYWIQSYHCREAVRNYTSSDPQLDDYVLNHIYCL
jgi:hypothetical protein